MARKMRGHPRREPEVFVKSPPRDRSRSQRVGFGPEFREAVDRGVSDAPVSLGRDGAQFVQETRGMPDTIPSVTTAMPAPPEYYYQEQQRAPAHPHYGGFAQTRDHPAYQEPPPAEERTHDHARPPACLLYTSPSPRDS